MAYPFQASQNPSHVPPGYDVTENGLFQITDKKRPRRLTTVAVCVQALTHSLTATEWSILLAWTDSNGNSKSAILDYSALHRKHGEALEELAGEGLFIIPGMTSAVAIFISISAALPAIPRVVTNRQLGLFTVERNGASGNLAFMLPSVCLYPKAPEGNEATNTVASASTEILFHPLFESGTYDLYRQSGTLEQWQSGLRPAASNALIVFAVSLSFAAPLQTLANVDTFIAHLFGASSTGKTAGLQSAVSVWGMAGDPQRAGLAGTLIERWHTTGNAIEGTAASHSGILLAFDELGASGETAMSVYNITAGSGKARMTETGGLRSQHHWALCILSTGEGSMQDKIEATSKRKILTGELIRALDIPVAELAKNGDLSQDESANLIDALKQHCTEFHGSAGPAFIQAVLDHFQTEAALREWLTENIAHFHLELIREAQESGRTLGPAHVRAMRRFAFVAAVGSLASHLGVSPFTEDEVLHSISAVVEAWLQALPPLSEGERAIEAIRDYVVRNHAQILKWEDRDTLNFPTRYAPNDMRAILKNGLLLFTPDQFEQACDGMSTKEALRQLRSREMLHYEKDKTTYRVSIAELDMVNFRFYAVNIKRLLSGNDLALVQTGVGTPVLEEVVTDTVTEVPPVVDATARAPRTSGPVKRTLQTKSENDFGGAPLF